MTSSTARPEHRTSITRNSPRATAPGFTLIEMLIAVSILAAMMTLAWGSFSLTARSTRRTDTLNERYRQLRLAMNRMAREISMAYMSTNELENQVNPRFFFISERSGSVDELMFTSLAHMRLRANAKESEQSVIRYYAAPDRLNRRITHLMRRESNRLGGTRPTEEGAAFVLLEDVQKLHFEFFDEQQNEWRERWNTKAADGQPNRLPSKVRIKLTIRDESGKELELVTATRTFIPERLFF